MRVMIYIILCIYTVEMSKSLLDYRKKTLVECLLNDKMCQLLEVDKTLISGVNRLFC